MNFWFASKTSHEHLFEIFSSPFHTDVDKAPADIQMELIDLQERTDLKAKYVEMNLGDFYRKYLDQDKFPKLRKFVASKQMGFMKSAYRSVLTDKHLENGLRVASTSIKVNLDEVVQKKANCIFLTELFPRTQNLSCYTLIYVFLF